ncbi:hypothetical protein ACFL3Q_04530 [Planctomycetota bacterium]
MRNINYSSKKAICSICVILALWTLGAHAATLPPDPDNAALLYYQAFLLRPEPDEDTYWSIDEVVSGGEPDEKLIEYLNLRDCRKTIEFTEAAAQLPHCNWGIRFSQGFGSRLPQLVHFRPLMSLFYADARVLAMDGDYRAALGRCLTIRRFAGHVGMLNYAIALGTDMSALRYIQNILGSMPPDAETLTWLRGQLAAVHSVIPSLARAVEMDLELVLQSWRNDPNDLLWLREQLAENDEGNDPEYFWSLTDEELLALIATPYADFLNYALRVIDSEMPYEEKYTELQRLIDELKDEFGSDPGTKLLVLPFAPQVIEIYSLQVRHTTQFNALKAAIEIYLATANSGQLPETLPDYLPKDPFSGQDFEYEITEKGFVLRCQAKDILASQAIWPPGTDSDVVHEYEFELQM